MVWLEDIEARLESPDFTVAKNVQELEWKLNQCQVGVFVGYLCTSWSVSCVSCRGVMQVGTIGAFSFL